MVMSRVSGGVSGKVTEKHKDTDQPKDRRGKIIQKQQRLGTRYDTIQTQRKTTRPGDKGNAGTK